MDRVLLTFAYMKYSSATVLAATTLLCLAQAIACSSKGPDGAAATGDEANIIGGVDAKSASLNAVGAIVFRDRATNQLSPLCTATLIGPQTILTAKHCAVQFTQTPQADGGPPSPLTETRFLDSLKEMYFSVGFDTKTATKLVPLDGVTVCNDYQGGWVGLGCDIAVYHLKDAVTDIKPLKITDAAFTDASIGKKVAAIGYGSQNQPETALGTRKVGALTLRATQGSPLHALYPTLEAFTAALTEAEGVAFVSNSAADLGALYNQEMKSGSEVFLGAAEGDAQVCHGDSGGPLLQNVNGELVVQGVLSAMPFAGARLSCQSGAIYELPTSAPARALIAASLIDPCAGVPSVGRCEGDVAVRCTRPDEGPRRLVKTDCSAILQHCVAPEPADAGSEAGATREGGAATDAGAAAEVSCMD